MQKLIVRFVPLATLVAVLFVFAACSDDDESNPAAPPTTGSVSGKVTFTGSWPSTGEVQVSIYSNLSAPWIPMGPPDGFTNPIQSGVTEYDYSISGLDFGTYSAIYVGWRDPGNPAGAKLIGMFWSFVDSVGISSMTGLPVTQPNSTDLSSSNADQTSLNITADLDLAP